jgi:type I restriction enzyme R subunit/putative DNA methylase
MSDSREAKPANAGVPAGMQHGHAGAGEDACVPGGGVPGRSGEWYSRGYLPHRDRIGLLQSITFRLADSLPQEMLRELELELAGLSESRRDVERRRRIEEWLDSGMGCCALRHPAVARIVQDSLLYFDGERYRMIAWCIMPNHVHALVEPLVALEKIVHGWKSVRARRLLARNEELGLGIPDAGHLWMREYWDRFIRDERHLGEAIGYIHQNPVKAGLCDAPEKWMWSSAAGKAGA